MDRDSADMDSGDFVDPLLGTMIGRYRVEKKIGQGGMGAVYSLVQPAIHKRMALKLLHEQYAERPDIVQRFFGEAKAVNLIGHPNIVDITDFSHLPDGRPFIIMEFLEGQSLEDDLDERGPLGPDEVVQLLRPLCSALEAAHAKGVVHRDLKPENVFLARLPRGEIQLKVLDFGIAKLRSTGSEPGVQTKTGVVLGTPTYMSPEQAEGKTQLADHRTDIYSLGVLLHQMLTGHPPFRGSTFAELILQHIHDAPPPLHDTRDDLPPVWNEVVARALAKSPSHRFQSMSELLDAAECALTESAVHSTEAPPPAALSQSRALLLLPIVLVAGATMAFFLSRKAPESDLARGPSLSAMAPEPLEAPAPAVAEAPKAAPAAAPAATPAPAPAAAPAPKTQGEAVAKPPDKRRGKGMLRISANPWAQVYLDGEHIGQTPIEKEIPAGRHNVRLKNETTGISRSHRFRLKKGDIHTIREKW